MARSLQRQHRPRRRRRVIRLQPTAVHQRPAKDELDLRVEAAQVVVRPVLDRFQHGGIDAEEEGTALRQNVKR